MRTVAQIDADLERLRQELVCAEDCGEHRSVAVIRDEIHALLDERNLVPVQRA